MMGVFDLSARQSGSETIIMRVIVPTSNRMDIDVFPDPVSRAGPLP
jgi:hypothetical protein